MVGVVDGALPLPPWFEFAAPSIDTVDVFDNEVGEDAGPDEAGEVTVPGASGCGVMNPSGAPSLNER